MASFSFGAGNVRKLASIPLYALGRIATLVIPRSRDEWVIGCAVGIGDGALALWDVARANDERELLWLVGSPAEAREADARAIRHAPKNSIRGFWRTARARVVVVTHGFGDVNRYAVSGAFIVQLWHGIPLKRLGLDSPETVRSGILADSALVRRLLAAMYRFATRRIRVLPAASHVVRGRLESAFSLPDAAVPVTGEPRVDVLSRGSAEDRRTGARAGIARATAPFSSTTRLVLYAPTWRDGAVDPAIPSAAQWISLLDVLQRHDAILLVRSHPLGVGAYTPPGVTDRVRDLSSAAASDVTPLLPGLDVLITDYSSLAFDAALVPVPTLFLAPDVEEYARRRGFYGTYGDVAQHGWDEDWDAGTARLDGLLGDADLQARAVEDARVLSGHVHAFEDGRNTERVYRAIRRGLARDEVSWSGSEDAA